MLREGQVCSVREKAELLGNVSLGENGDALAEIAIQRALAWCQREDMPEAMEQAAAEALLALFRALPQAEEEDGGGDTGALEGFLPAGAVKTIQRGDTSVTFSTPASSTGGSASTLSGGKGGLPSAALEALAPWRRLGRLKREAP